jgi:hypothetical protein
MKLLYKPFGIVAGLLAGLLSRRIFDAIWAQIDEEEAPKPTHSDVPMAKIVTAAALQGVVFKTTRAAVDHYGARGFYHLTGTWPGKPKPDPK